MNSVTKTILELGNKTRLSGISKCNGYGSKHIHSMCTKHESFIQKNIAFEIFYVKFRFMAQTKHNLCIDFQFDVTTSDINVIGKDELERVDQSKNV